MVLLFAILLLPLLKDAIMMQKETLKQKWALEGAMAPAIEERRDETGIVALKIYLDTVGSRIDKHDKIFAVTLLGVRVTPAVATSIKGAAGTLVLAIVSGLAGLF